MSDRTYGTWYRDTSREAAMEEGHRPLWRHFIDIVPETDLSTRDVLDFGCNRGGFSPSCPLRDSQAMSAPRGSHPERPGPRWWRGS